MIDLLKSMIDWDTQPRRTAEAGAPIITSGEPTALIFCLETGVAMDSDGRAYGDGDLIGLCEALALVSYSTPVTAASTCRCAFAVLRTTAHSSSRPSQLVGKGAEKGEM